MRKHGRSGGTAAVLMPLPPPVSRCGHAPRSTDRHASGKQRPVPHLFGAEVDSRTVVIAALVTSLLLAAGATGLFKARRRLQGKPRRLVVRDDAGALLDGVLSPGHLPAFHHRGHLGHQGRVMRAGDVAVNCTASRGAVGRMCLAAHLQHSAAATIASRAAIGEGLSSRRRDCEMTCGT